MLKEKLGFLGGKLERKIIKNLSTISIGQPNSEAL